jgi:hypothetical protein
MVDVHITPGGRPFGLNRPAEFLPPYSAAAYVTGGLAQGRSRQWRAGGNVGVNGTAGSG